MAWTKTPTLPEWISPTPHFDGVILANGSFPTHPVPLSILESHARLICCDGAAEKLIANTNRSPEVIVGDLDSISQATKAQFESTLVEIADQNRNDLQKALEWSRQQGLRRHALLGLFGGREDHALGNFSLLWQYTEDAGLQVFTDNGVFTPVQGDRQLPSFPGQFISVFTKDPSVKVTSQGLKWPLEKRPFHHHFEGTLNQALSSQVQLRIEGGQALIFQTY